MKIPRVEAKLLVQISAVVFFGPEITPTALLTTRLLTIVIR